MFYPVSKLAVFLMQPSSIACLLIGTGLLLQRGDARRRLGRRLAFAGLGFLLAAGLLPIGNALVLPLEERFARVRQPAPEDRVVGIIMLGGFEDGWVTAGRGQLGLNEASERLTETMRLARKLPDARIVFTGGAGGGVINGSVDAATPVAQLLVDLGFARERIVLEAKSRNTHENATLSAQILKPRAGQRWVLVTSAYHMPRAVGIFRKAGFEVLPWPTDYRTRGWGDALRPFESIPDGFKRLDLAAKEWTGLLVYYLTGRTAELWPGPSPANLPPP